MRYVIGLVCLTTILLAPAWAQNTGACSNATTHGTYSVTCSGFMSPAAGAPQAPFSAIGVVTGTWSGKFSGGGKASLGGMTVDQTVSGMAVTNDDCTGTISYDQKINGQPAGKLNIVFHVLDDGKEIRGMGVDAGANLLCTLRLMSR